jgi:hypothetical protein
MPKRDEFADLVAAGMPEAAAREYLRWNQGWDSLTVRPAVLDLLRDLAAREGRPMHEIATDAIREYIERRK